MLGADPRAQLPDELRHDNAVAACRFVDLQDVKLCSLDRFQRVRDAGLGNNPGFAQRRGQRRLEPNHAVQHGFGFEQLFDLRVSEEPGKLRSGERMGKHAYAASSAKAIPCPTPTHIEASARLAPLSRSSTAALPAIRAPDIPSGWPSAIAPPLGLTRLSSS